MFAFGCFEPIERGNSTSIDGVDTNTTQSANFTSKWEQYDAKYFSFDYLDKMNVRSTTNTFVGEHHLSNGKTGEILVVAWLNISKVYGENVDHVYAANPTKTTSDLLLGDKNNNPDNVFNSYERDDIITYAIVKDTYVAEVPFIIEENGVRYNCYALSLYSPERSLYVKVRVAAIDPSVAEEMKKQFISSFRLR